MIPRVALVTCEAFPKLYEDDVPLVPALAALGLVGEPSVWNDPAVDWSSFDAIVIRSPWDYFERVAEFRAWLEARVAGRALLCNSGDVLTWNFDKRYLEELASAGVSVVPTVCVARGEKPDLAAMASARGWKEIVIKPSISGGGYRTHRLRIDDAGAYAAEVEAILRDRGLLMQPFLPEITEGELSLLFFDGVFSHAVRKRPKPGEYRVQFQFGGTTETGNVDSTLVEQARACVLAAPSLPVYARVDGVIKDKQFLLMELEVFEPLMFLSSHPEAAARFARALHTRWSRRH
jgi:glutathione synthase/RimK-type ligase-like ATP-grasp enzyme